ncbi:MAG TPA: hypothetical protein VFN67_06455 [Polyangiales bacterium]|nr:hypothetical protein [Polyangiales bacterium]
MRSRSVRPLGGERLGLHALLSAALVVRGVLLRLTDRRPKRAK